MTIVGIKFLTLNRNKEHHFGRQLAKFAATVVELCKESKDRKPAEQLEDINSTLRSWIGRMVGKLLTKFPQLHEYGYLVKMTVQHILFNLIYAHLFKLYKRKVTPSVFPVMFNTSFVSVWAGRRKVCSTVRRFERVHWPRYVLCSTQA